VQKTIQQKKPGMPLWDQAASLYSSSSRREDTVFYNALIVSLVLHVIVLVKFAYSNAHSLRNPLTKIEVTYRVIEQTLKDAGSTRREEKSVLEKKLTENEKIFLKKDPFPAHLVKDLSQFSERTKESAKQPARAASFDVKEKISIPEFKSDKIDGSKYLDYRRKIRELIRERVWAYFHNSYPELESGKVYVSFILSREGTLKQAQIVEDKTTANQILREVALRSVKDQSSYPPLPQDLNFPEVSIGVIISFELKD